MRVLVFDTETTGLPEGRNPSIFDTEKWPHVVQLSWILYDTDAQRHCDIEDLLISTAPPSTAGSLAIHGISHTTCQRKGIPIMDAIQQFDIALRSCDLVVGHNISFDKRMMMVEGIRNNYRLGFSNPSGKKPEHCTMKSNVEFCGIEAVGADGGKYLKYPQLMELYSRLFKDKPRTAHNAMADVFMCLRCYCILQHQIDVAGKGPTKKLFNLYCT
jgi:DNA polymerase III epsilon subunit-like protein